MATFGRTNPIDGGSSWSTKGNNEALGAKFQIPDNGNLASISVHVKAPTDGGTTYVAIYNDNAGAVGTKVASDSGIASGTGDQWITVNLSASLVENNYYWLCADNADVATLHGDINVADNYRADWYATAGTWADNPSSVSYSEDWDMAIYATYNLLTTSTSTSSTTTSSSTTQSTSTSKSTSTSSTTTSSSISQSKSTSTSSTTTSSSSSKSTSTSISTTTTSSSTSISTTRSTSTSISTSTTTTINPTSGELAFGEENPTEGEIPISWQTWSDGIGFVPTVTGDPDWGKINLEFNEEGRSRVYDFGNADNKGITLTEDRYEAGQESATLQIRGSADTLFNQDDVGPAWENYTSPIPKTWRYIQVRAIKNI